MVKIDRAYHETILINDDYFKSLIAAILSAKKSIDLEVYIFENDELGTLVANALINSAERGIPIRVLVDGVGTRNWENLQFRMERAGIKTKIYHPLFWSLFKWPIPWNDLKNIFHHLAHISSRNHRKTCIIDNKIAYIGSANIIKFTKIQGENKRWLDISVRITGLSLTEFTVAFDLAWNCTSSRPKHLLSINGKEPILRFNYTWPKRRYNYKSLLKKIEKAQNTIFIANAYFVPRRFLLLKLKAAAKRGVDVRIVVPQNPDVMGISLLMSSFYSTLLKSGVKIFHHTQEVLHTKLIIIDNWFSIGSSNLNYRSLYYDLEVDIVLQTKEAKQLIEKQFYDYCSHSKAILLNDLPKQTFFKKIAINFLWIVRFLF